MIRTTLNETEIEREYVKNVSFDENDIGIIERTLRVSLDRVIWLVVTIVEKAGNRRRSRGSEPVSRDYASEAENMRVYA